MTPPSSTIETEVAVLGAGAAGLSAAWALVEAGRRVCVVERDAQVGGLSQTVRREGFSFDLGGHRIISSYRYIIDKLRHLLGDELLVRRRKSQIRFGHKYYAYPLDAKDLLSKLPPWQSARCFGGYVLTRLFGLVRTPSDDSLEDWIVNRFGRPLYELYFGPYSRKLWGCSPKEISSDWAVQRISLLNLWDVVRRLVLPGRTVPKTYALQFYYPAHGIGEIWEKVADLVRSSGQRIELNCTVKEVRVKGDRAVEIVCKRNDSEFVVHAEHVISTIPLPTLLAALRPAPPSRVLDAARQFRFRSVRFLNVMLDQPQVTDNTWIYASEPETLFFRIQEPRNWSPYNAPPGKTSLILEIACNCGDAIWRADDDEIYTRCVADLAAMGIDIRKTTLGYFSTWVEHAYPVYDLAYVERLRAVRPALDAIRNLICCGRQGLFRYNNMDHSMHMGFLAADVVLGRALREAIWEVGTEGEIFERDVV